MSGPISAPYSIDPMVSKLKVIADAISGDMQQLAAETAKLRASGTAGAAVDAYEAAARLWNTRGSSEADRSIQMATASNNYMQDMHNLDRTAQGWF
jgi:uncharacterized protein YukE